MFSAALFFSQKFSARNSPPLLMLMLKILPVLFDPPSYTVVSEKREWCPDAGWQCFQWELCKLTLLTAIFSTNFLIYASVACIERSNPSPGKDKESFSFTEIILFMLLTFGIVLLEFLLWNMSSVFKVSLHQNNHACATEFRELTEKWPSPQYLQHWKPFSCSLLCLLTALEVKGGRNAEITSVPILLL